MPRLLQRLAVGFGGILFALVLLEIAARALSAFAHGNLEELAGAPSLPPGTELRLGDLLRLNPDDRIVYELRPGLRGRFLGREIAINSLGMRSPERAIEKPPRVFRIVGLGDSVMFGWGVAAEDSYPSILERSLAERFPDRRFEVWNLAVPGYDAVQEVESFAKQIDRLDPDLVVIGWVGNDMDLPNFLAAGPPVTALDRSFLADLVARRWRARHEPESVDSGLFEVPHDEETGRFLLDRSEIPERYWALAGWDNMKDAYRRLRRMTAERGIPAVVVFAGGQRAFKTFCAEQGFLVVESQHLVLRYEKEHGVDRHVALQISQTDPHPNAIGHGLIAKALFEKLVESDVLTPRGK